MKTRDKIYEKTPKDKLKQYIYDNKIDLNNYVYKY